MERIPLELRACALSWGTGRCWKGEEEPEAGSGEVNPERAMGCVNIQKQGRVLQGQGILNGAGCSGHCILLELSKGVRRGAVGGGLKQK